VRHPKELIIGLGARDREPSGPVSHIENASSLREYFHAQGAVAVEQLDAR
jgi:hypothetical protein